MNQFRIWIVDDEPENLEMIERSFPTAIQDAVEVRSFMDVYRFLNELSQSCQMAKDRLPDFILLDFFLGRMYGWQALERIFSLYTSAQILREQQAVIIAHSSMPSASESLVKDGADFILPKITRLERSLAIEQNFCSVEAIHWMRQHRQAWVDKC